MSAGHPTAPQKPSKPYPDFPLFPHATRRWAKKIRGKMHYFGPWEDPDGTLKKYLEQKDALHAGRTPRPDTEGLTVKQLCNTFLNAKQARVDTGELSPRTWADYKEVTDLLVKHLGKTRLVADLGPGDFSALRAVLTKRWEPCHPTAICATREIYARWHAALARLAAHLVGELTDWSISGFSAPAAPWDVALKESA